MISNPCNWFISGSDMRNFTYEGGKTLYHFSPNDNNLSRHMDCNIVFFANDEKHGLDVLKRMLEFRIACAVKYIKKSYHEHEFTEQMIDDKKEAASYLRALEAGKIKLSVAPTNQFYKVGWAENDNILS